MNLRKIGSSAIIIMVVCCSFLFSYLTVPQLSYADDESFFELEGDALDAAMQAYANARGGGFTTANKQAFLTWVRYDQTFYRQLVGHIKADRNSKVLQFIYDNTAITLLNNWFDSFMSQYDLPSEPDFNDNPNYNTIGNIYSGELFTDDDGNKCLVYHFNTTPSGNTSVSSQNYSINNVSAIGSWLKYTKSSFTGDSLTCNWNISGTNYSLKFDKYNLQSTHLIDSQYTGTGFYWSRTSYNYDSLFVYTNNNYIVDGKTSVVKDSSGRYYVGMVALRSDSNILRSSYRNTFSYYLYKLPSNIQLPPTNIDVRVPSGYKDPLDSPSAPYYITPKKPNGDVYTINNNEGDDYTTIYNNEINNYIDNSITNINYPIVQTTPYVPDDPTPEDPDPDTPTPDDPVVPDDPDYSDYLQAYLDYYEAWNDIIAHIDNDLHSIKSKLDSVINYLRAILLAIISPQAFDPSDLPNMDFSLPVNLEDKFPFCIPFDILMFASVLKAEPEAPSFQGDIDFTIYTWHAEFDLTDFDDMAEKIRLVEYLGFLVGLMVFTAYLFKG